MPSLLPKPVSDPPEGEPFDASESLDLGKRAGANGEPPRTIHFAPLAASLLVHALTMLAVFLTSPAILKPELETPGEEVVAVSLDTQPVFPELEVVPEPASPAPPRSAPPPEPASPASPPPTPETREQQVPPVGPLPEPNRMGEKLLVPPPPRPSKGDPPPDATEPLLRADRTADVASPTPLGSPEGPRETGPPNLEEDGGSSEQETTEAPGGVPVREADGSLPAIAGPEVVPLRPSGSGEGAPVPGEPSGGPQRRGLNYGVPLDAIQMGDFTAEHPEHDWTDYWSTMYWAIWRAWHNRLLFELPGFERDARSGGDGSLYGDTLVRFTIERNGNVTGIEVLEASGIRSLDLSAVDALKEVILPPLTADIPHDRERITGKFILRVPDIRMLRQGLYHGKRVGQF